MASEVGTAFVSILPSLRGFSADLKRQLRSELVGIDPVVRDAGTRAGRTFGSSMGNALSSSMARIGSILKTGLLVGGTAAVAGLGALTAFGLKSAASLEQTQIGLEALIGSAEEAKKFLGELQDFAAKTPFEFQGVADASRRILAFGTSVGITREQVIPTLTTIGDLVSVLGGSQENIDSVVRALGQMASKGKVSQEEILQLAEALPGFNANAAIASALGLSVADTLDLITAGGVDATTGINALLAGMAQFPGAAGAMAKQAETLKGVFSTFKDTIAIALTNAFQPVIPGIKTALSDVTPVLGDAINKIAPQLGQLLETLLPLVGILSQAITPVLGPAIEAFASFIPQLTPALIPLGAALGRVVEAFAPLIPVLGEVIEELVNSALVPVIEELTPQFAELVGPVGDLLIALIPIIPPLGELLVLMLRMQAPLIQLTALVTEFLAIEAIGPAVQFLADKLNALFDIIRPGITLVSDIGNWPQIFENLKASLGPKIDAIGGFFSALPGKIGAFLSGLPDLLANLAKEAFLRFAFVIGDGIGTVIKFFIDLPGTIGNLVTNLWSMVTGLFTSGVENTKQGFVTGTDRIIEFAKALPGKIIDAVMALPGQLAAFGSNLGSQMYQIGRDIVFGAINGIRSAIGGLISTLRDGFASAVAGVKHGLGIGSPSKVFASIGEDSIAGYVKGIQDSAMSATAATLGAISPAASAPAAAAAPRPVNVTTDDPLINLVIGHIREAVRTTYGGDVEFAFGTA